MKSVRDFFIAIGFKVAVIVAAFSVLVIGFSVASVAVQAYSLKGVIGYGALFGAIGTFIGTTFALVIGLYVLSLLHGIYERLSPSSKNIE
jgi:uncharacterized membrane protein